jgi:hypothetical protein
LNVIPWHYLLNGKGVHFYIYEPVESSAKDWKDGHFAATTTVLSGNAGHWENNQLPDASIDFLIAESVISDPELYDSCLRTSGEVGQRMMKEAFRVLKDGGYASRDLCPSFYSFI